MNTQVSCCVDKLIQKTKNITYSSEVRVDRLSGTIRNPKFEQPTLNVYESPDPGTHSCLQSSIVKLNITSAKKTTNIKQMHSWV